MTYLEKPQPYLHWVKSTVRMCFPMKHDFYGFGDALLEVGKFIGTQVVRLLILVLFPLSVPVLAYIFWKQNRKVMNARAKRLTEEWDGFPPQYTKDEVQMVLDGHKTLDQLSKEKEQKYLDSY